MMENKKKQTGQEENSNPNSPLFTGVLSRDTAVSEVEKLVEASQALHDIIAAARRKSK